MHITDRLYQSKWGVFNHYLYGEQNRAGSQTNQGAGETDWNTCVNALDVRRIAKNLHEAGAHYYFFTVMQGRKYMAAPNAAFDRIAGTKPGEACSERDLILDLSDALQAYGIDLYLYFTGDGPYKDEEIGRKFGFIEPRGDGVTRPFVEKWAEVLEEYAVRYGKRISGWWIDGCYREYFKYDDELLSILYQACKKGNPDAVVALNNGVSADYRKNYKNEDYVCGEFNDFLKVPGGRFTDGAQNFMLAPLGVSTDGSEWGAWCRYGTKRSGEYLHHFISCVNLAGGVVTIDMALNRDGSFDPAQMEALRQIRI